MAASDAAIANAALSHLGVAGRIVTLATDPSSEARVCREFLPRARAETIKSAPWSVATKTAPLLLLEDFNGSDAEWRYRYRLPEDCIQPRRILWRGIRNPLPDQQPSFIVAADTISGPYDDATEYVTGDYVSVTAGGVWQWYRALQDSTNQSPVTEDAYWEPVSSVPDWLMCDVESAQLEYTFDLVDPTRYGPDLEAAIVALLAYYIASSVTVNGSAIPLQQKVAGIWEQKINEAREADARARQRDPAPISAYEAARLRYGRR